MNSATASRRSRSGLDQMEEAVQIIKSLFDEDVTHFKGNYYDVQGAVCAPKPVKREAAHLDRRARPEAHAPPWPPNMLTGTTCLTYRPRNSGNTWNSWKRLATVWVETRRKSLAASICIS